MNMYAGRKYATISYCGIIPHLNYKHVHERVELSQCSYTSSVLVCNSGPEGLTACSYPSLKLSETYPLLDT